MSSEPPEKERIRLKSAPNEVLYVVWRPERVANDRLSNAFHASKGDRRSPIWSQSQENVVSYRVILDAAVTVALPPPD